MILNHYGWLIARMLQLLSVLNLCYKFFGTLTQKEMSWSAPLDSVGNVDTDTNLEVSMHEIKKILTSYFATNITIYSTFWVNVLLKHIGNANPLLHCTLICDFDFVSTEIFLTLSEKSAEITSNIQTKGSGIVFTQEHLNIFRIWIAIFDFISSDLDHSNRSICCFCPGQTWVK